METRSEKTWRPVAAGILNIATGLLSVSGTLLLVYFAISIATGRSRLERALREGSRAFPAILVFLSLVLLVVGILLVTGGVFAIRRKNWSIAAMGSVAAIVLAILAGIPLFNYSVPAVALLVAIGLASVILTMRSKHEFS
jgi:uncharacterized integral membrane protein